MNDEQIANIDSALKLLKTTLESGDAEVQVTFDQAGNFKVVASKNNRTVVLARGFNLRDDDTNKSVTVDVLFRDTDLDPTEYGIIMTESEPDDYPWNIQEGQRLMTAFFGGQFEKRTVKKLFFFKSEDLWFTADGLTYVAAVALR